MVRAMPDQPAAPRLAWFCDLEMLAGRLDLLRILRDELGLTTVVPESHICHTSGFAPSPEVVAASPVEGWRTSPTLALHREAFHVAEPAFAVLPGVVSGFDDTPLRRVIDECRRLGLEVWGHAGLWCYGGEVFPELAVRDLFGRALPATSLAWGTPFCPSKPHLHAWIKLSLTDVIGRYDLDGLFLDHARYTSPGDGPSLLTCGCADCAREAAARGYDLDEMRRGLRALREALAATPPAHLAALTAAGPVEALTLLAGHRGVVDWFFFRARLLADQFADIAQAVRQAAGRPLPFGSDVFPPSVALLGGHLYREWARGATYFTGGFGGRIGWGTVGAVVIDHLAPWLRAWAPGLDGGAAAQLVARLIGYDHPALGLRFDGAGRVEQPNGTTTALTAEIGRMAAASGGLPVYPPVASGHDEAALRTICRGIVAAGLAGAMFSGLERFTAEQRALVRRELAERLPSP
jgi:hypothetical protein